MDGRHPPEFSRPTIVPRKGPDLDLDGDIPRYWLGGDPFKTRFFDAMSILFPEGEKFFIACVRDFREQIADPALAAAVKDFTFQEGQHGMVHTQFNNRLKAQGIAVDAILAEQKRIEFSVFRKYFSRRFTLGQTAACEHLTALMAYGFFAHGVLRDADPRIRAMYAWHAVEEIEHKSVAFDVYRDVAKGGYFTRIGSLLFVSVTFPLHVFLIMRHMFKVDQLPNRWALWRKGLWWLYGPGGLFPPMLRDYLHYFRPAFHPAAHGDPTPYDLWRAVYDRTGGDAIAAGDAVVHQAT